MIFWGSSGTERRLHLRLVISYVFHLFHHVLFFVRQSLISFIHSSNKSKYRSHHFLPIQDSSTLFFPLELTNYFFLLSHYHQHKNPHLNPIALSVFQFIYLFPFTLKFLESLHTQLSSIPLLPQSMYPPQLGFNFYHSPELLIWKSLLILLLPDLMVSSPFS